MVIGIAAASVAVGEVRAQDPKVPPGKASEGTPVAVFSTGLDYTQPDIAAALARDGEGELIGRDFADGDRTPFAAGPSSTLDNWGGDGTALARTLLLAMATSGSKFNVVPVRIDPAKPLSLAQALAFVAQTPAKVVIVPMWSLVPADWEPFKAAATHFKDLRILVPACSTGTAAGSPPVYPHALALPNVTSVAADPALVWAGVALTKSCP